MNERGARLSADDRFDLAMSASAREQRNRPRLWVVGSLVVLAVCSAVFLSAHGSRAAAARELGRETFQTRRTAELIGELRRLEAQRERPGQRAYATDLTFVTNLQQAMRGTGIVNPSAPDRRDGAQVSDGVMIRHYSFQRLRAPSVETLLGAVRTIMDRFPGLEVESIKLEPQAREWTMNVTFRRLETTT
jgi:hypothetical protein